MKTLFIAAGLLWLWGCAAVPRPMLTENLPADPPYVAWQRVLERHVDDAGRVNFAAVARDRADLDRFVAWIYENGPNNRAQSFPTPDHVLAFHINAYNALAMYKVLETGTPITLAGIRKVSFFYLGKVQVGGKALSLYDYENKVIRPLGEPRVHVALNCMSVSCPRLPREPFFPERLDEQLDRAARLFFNETRNVQVDDASQTLRLSEILKFYSEDFIAAAPSLLSYVSRYRSSPLPDTYALDFIPYDWTINRQPGT